MAITYTWRIDPLEIKPTDGSLTDVVCVAHWQLTGVDDATQIETSLYGKATFASADVNNFTAYDNLTEEQVIGWVINAAAIENGQTPEQAEQSLKDTIITQINEIVLPSIVSKNPPWYNYYSEETS